MTTSVLIFGKFLPPHLGHIGLVHQAIVDFSSYHNIVVIICATKNDYIRPELRKQWLQLLCPEIIVEIVDSDHLPQSTEASVENAEAWVNELISGPNQIVRKYDPKVIYSSEHYGNSLSNVFIKKTGTFIKSKTYDIRRHKFPISSTQIRQNPIEHWEWVPKPIRKYLVTKVCVVGPESTGKTTLVKSIANIIGCPYVEEQARPWLTDHRPLEDDFYSIVLLHAGKVLEACTQSKNGLVIVDTDAYTTEMYYRRYGYGVPKTDLIKLVTNEVKYDFYLLTHPTIPYIKDELREFKDFQLDILHELRDHLEFEKIPFSNIIQKASIPRALEGITAIDNFLRSR